LNLLEEVINVEKGKLRRRIEASGSQIPKAWLPQRKAKP